MPGSIETLGRADSRRRPRPFPRKRQRGARTAFESIWTIGCSAAGSHCTHIRHIIESLEGRNDVEARTCQLHTLRSPRRGAIRAKTLQATEERYRSAFDQTAVSIVHTSLDGRLRLVNQAFCAMSGYSRAEALRITHSRCYPFRRYRPQHRGTDQARRRKRPILSEGAPTASERRLIRVGLRYDVAGARGGRHAAVFCFRPDRHLAAQARRSRR